MFNCIIFYNSSKNYGQFQHLPDKVEILVKSKMAAILAATLNEVTDPKQRHSPYLVYYMADYL